MSTETSAALWGAVVGGLLTFIASYFIELKRARDSKNHAISLFKYVNKEWLAMNKLATPQAASYKRDLELLDKIFDQVRPTIINCGCVKIVEAFLKYNLGFNEVRYCIQAGSPGLVNYPTDRMKEVFEQFESSSNLDNCCG